MRTFAGLYFSNEINYDHEFSEFFFFLWGGGDAKKGMDFM